jgi:hypothetical protein
MWGAKRERAHQLFGVANHEAALAIYEDLVAGSRSKRARRTFQAELRYAIAGPGGLVLDAGLARALRRFAEVRVAGQHELERALPAVHDAVGIYGALAQSPDRAEQERFTSELEETAQVWADVLEALARADEAAEVLERLAPIGGLRQRNLKQIWADVRHCVDRQLE